MKCLSCNKQFPSDHQLSQNPSFASKKAEIQSLKNLIHQSKQKLNLTLQQFSSLCPSRTQQSGQQQKSEIKTQRKLLNKKLDEISEKQDRLKKMKSLKKKIKDKALVLQQLKRAHNQKLTEFDHLERVLSSLKQQIVAKSRIERRKLQSEIEDKKRVINKVDKIVKRNMQEVVNVDLMSLWRMNDKLIEFEKKEALRIKQVDDLEFMDNLRPEDCVAQGFIELGNIEEVFLQKKLSQKAIHLLYQNILIFTILRKLCNFWLPYGINCEINFNESKLVSRIGEVSILNKKMIDFAKSTQLSSNIVQFFPDEIKKNNSSQNKKLSSNSQNSQQFCDESLEYYKRKYQLNQGFVNCLQVNVEYLCTKYGIKERPLVFLDSNLMKRIVEQCHYMWLENERIAVNDNRGEKGFISMLKQVQVSKMIEQKQINSCRVQIQAQSEHQQIQMRDDSQGSQIRQTNDRENYWISIKQSVYELIVPESLEKVTSSDTDNDEFQLLTF